MKAGPLCSGACGLLLLALTGCDQSQAGPSKPEAYTVKGDKLGMDLQEYQRKHPGSCTEAGKSDRGQGDVVCPTSDTTYAGIKAERSADFFHGKLFEVRYTFNAADTDDMVAALKSKFGNPSKDDIGGGSALIWRNGISTIKYAQSQDAKQGKIAFSLDSLQAEAMAYKEKQKAESRKSDM
jgi:hypothetical protein